MPQRSLSAVGNILLEESEMWLESHNEHSISLITLFMISVVGTFTIFLTFLQIYDVHIKSGTSNKKC
jgi:hypothetical protein